MRSLFGEELRLINSINEMFPYAHHVLPPFVIMS